MESGARWYVLMWVAPADPCANAYFEHAGPFETRAAAVAAAREAKRSEKGDRFVRVIASAAAPTGAQWDDAEGIEPAAPDERTRPRP